MPWYEYAAQTGRRPLPIIQVRLRHGMSNVPVDALLDSGADSSLIALHHADLLGLDRNAARVGESIGASGVRFATYRWPDADTFIEFQGEQIPFAGSFAQFTPSTGGMNLLGRADFFQRFIVQFWDAAELMNIDLSPDFPQPASR